MGSRVLLRLLGIDRGWLKERSRYSSVQRLTLGSRYFAAGRTSALLREERGSYLEVDMSSSMN
jgi:hypothetical protein